MGGGGWLGDVYFYMRMEHGRNCKVIPSFYQHVGSRACSTRVHVALAFYFCWCPSCQKGITNNEQPSLITSTFNSGILKRRKPPLRLHDTWWPYTGLLHRATDD